MDVLLESGHGGVQNRAFGVGNLREMNGVNVHGESRNRLLRGSILLPIYNAIFSRSGALVEQIGALLGLIGRHAKTIIVLASPQK